MKKYTNKHFTMEDLKKHCESAIKVCEEKIDIIDSEKGKWVKLKELWEQQLKECEEELKNKK